MLVDNIRAQKNVWLIGDDFLKRNYQAYPMLRSEAVANDTKPPYLFSNYNVSTFTTGDKQIKNPMVKIVNGLIEAFNKYHTMPRFIIIIPDWDILKYINFYKFGASKFIGTMVDWLITEVSSAVDDKKAEMKTRRPGSVVSLEPKLIMIKMIDRPGTSDVLESREKYNAVLEEALFQTKKMYIMDINASLDFYRADFEVTSNLNFTGRKKYWAEFDAQLADFDQQKIKLKPMPVISHTKQE